MSVSVQDNIENGVYENKLEWTTSKQDRTKQIAYRSEDQRLRDLFEYHLALEFSLEMHPKRGKIFDMAWERAHSEGLQRVYDEYSELSELVL
jgi:hypothetical protein